MITIQLPDNVAEADACSMCHEMQMYFLWYGGDTVKGFDFNGNHVIDIPLEVENTIFRAKIAIQRYTREALGL